MQISRGRETSIGCGRKIRLHVVHPGVALRKSAIPVARIHCQGMRNLSHIVFAKLQVACFLKINEGWSEGKEEQDTDYDNNQPLKPKPHAGVETPGCAAGGRLGH